MIDRRGWHRALVSLPGSILCLVLLNSLLLTACSSSNASAYSSPTASLSPMPAETPADPSPTSIGLPTTTATDDDAIWQFIRDWVTGHIDLVLRPTWLPSGLDSATVDILANKPDHDTHMARYTGTAGSLWIGAGFLNPPAAMEGTEELVDVRGNQAHLYDASTDDSWVYWQEAGVEPPGRLYVVRGTMGKDAILHVAQSLEPYP